MKNDAVFNLLPEEELLAQLAEECSEAAKAALETPPRPRWRESYASVRGGSLQQLR